MEGDTSFLSWFFGLLGWPFVKLWSLLKLTERFSPLIIALTIIIVSSAREAYTKKNFSILIDNTLGRIISLDRSIGTLADKLYTAPTFWIWIQALCLFVLMGYLFWLLMFVAEWFTGQDHKVNTIGLALVFLYSYLIFGNLYYKVNNPFWALRGTFSFIMLLLDRSTYIKHKYLENISELRVNLTGLNST